MSFTGDSIFWVEVEKIVPNPYQPRREFDEERLKELAESVRMYGILQPLTVTRKEVIREDGSFYSQYELIAGERRLRAARLAGLIQVPVIIREGEQDEQEKLELAIIENLQREDLNAVDRALAFKQLADAFNLPHAQVAKKVGRSREYVSNSIRLLLLPDHMLDSLKVGDISEGHARTLLMLNDKPEEQDTVYREILLKKMSVRETERIARKIAHEKVRKKDANSDPQLIELERKFTESLGTRVQILKTDYGGKLTIDYFSEEDLEKMYAILAQDRDDALTFANEPAQAAAVASESSAMGDLTERTGLEAAPMAEAAPHEPVPEEPVQPMPAHQHDMHQQTESADQEPTQAAHHTPEPPMSEPEPEPAPQSAPRPAAEPTHQHSYLSDDTDANLGREMSQPAPEPPTPQPEPVEVPTPTAEPSQPERSEQPSQGNVAQPDTPIAEALRRDIAQYLEADETTTPAPQTATEPAASQSSTPEHADESTEVPVDTDQTAQPFEQPTQQPKKQEDSSDDSSLYGIRNFTL